jgi:hypothetical protein
MVVHMERQSGKKRILGLNSSGSAFADNKGVFAPVGVSIAVILIVVVIVALKSVFCFAAIRRIHERTRDGGEKRWCGKRQSGNGNSNSGFGIRDHTLKRQKFDLCALRVDVLVLTRSAVCDRAARAHAILHPTPTNTHDPPQVAS